MIPEPFLIKLFKNANLPVPVAEYKFHPDRKWRFDYAWPELKVALEIEGGIWVRGRHNRGIGMINDMVKYNSAAILGWRILRYTPQNISRSVDDVAQLLQENK